MAKHLVPKRRASTPRERTLADPRNQSHYGLLPEKFKVAESADAADVDDPFGRLADDGCPLFREGRDTAPPERRLTIIRKSFSEDRPGVGSELERAINNAYHDPDLSDGDRSLKLQYLYELAGHARRMHITVRDV
jgi:hypothetical protein